MPIHSRELRIHPLRRTAVLGLTLVLTAVILSGVLPSAAASGVSSLSFRSTGLTAAQVKPPQLETAAPLSIGLPLNYAELDQATMQARLDDAQAAGVTTIQAGAVWWYLCPTRTCNYAGLDRFVSAAEARQLSVTLQVTGVPDWVHPELASQPADQRRWTLPRNDAERSQFEKFTAELANRYRGKVTRYEIWNEPNLPEFSHPAPTPSGFARTLAAGYRGIKAGDNGAIVVSGGLSRSDIGFASAMLKELASLPGAQAHRLYFDEFGLHPYSDQESPEATVAAKVFTGAYGTVDNNFSGISRVTSLLDSYGRTDAKVYIGEYGFSTEDTWMSAVPDWRRGYYAALALDRVRSNPRVSGLVWYAFVPHSATGPEWATMNRDGAPSATFRSIAAVNTRSLEREWPGVSDGPIPMPYSRPMEHEWTVAPAAVRGLWTLNASSFGGTGVGRTEVFVDGHPLASADSAIVTTNTRAVSNGAHQVRVVWYDRQGTVIGYTSSATVTFDNSVNQALSASPVQIVRMSDGTYRARSTLVASPAGAVDFATVAVRDNAGRNFDFPGVNGFTVSPQGTVLSLQRSLPTGTYRAFVAVRKDGAWTNLPGEAVFVAP